MPIGKGRRPAPPGYMSAARAGEMLGSSRIYKLIKADRLHRFTPPGQKHGYYSELEVQQILDADKAFFEEKLHKIPAKFVQMKPSDTQSLYELATRIFGPGTISAEKRRALIEREPRGNYILKREGSTEVVGYFYLQSLAHERIMQYFKDCRGSTITPDEIKKIEPGLHEMIIAGIGRDPRADRQYVAVLLHGFMQELEKWGSEGIDITKFYAYSETIDGVFLCFSMGMELYERPRYIGGSPHFKFVIDVETSNIPLLQGYKRALQEYKRSQGQETVIEQPALPTMPTAQKSATTTRHARHPQTDMPEGYIPFATFFKLHNVAESTARRGIDTLFPVVSGQWNVNGFQVKQTLDAAGQRAFYEAYHSKASFTPCEQCPHT